MQASPNRTDRCLGSMPRVLVARRVLAARLARAVILAVRARQAQVGKRDLVATWGLAVGAKIREGNGWAVTSGGRERFRIGTGAWVVATPSEGSQSFGLPRWPMSDRWQPGRTGCLTERTDPAGEDRAHGQLPALSSVYSPGFLICAGFVPPPVKSELSSYLP
jgi:hypothetical protein